MSILDFAHEIENFSKMLSTAISSVTSALREAESAQSAILKAAYNEKTALAKKQADEEIAAYKDRIDQINIQLKELDRQAADDSYEDKIRRLNAALEFENDASNRYEIEKEIANLTAEYQLRKKKEALQDEKAVLQDMADWAKESYNAQKELYAEMLNSELNALKTQLDQKLNIIKEYQQSLTLQGFDTGAYYEIVRALEAMVNRGVSYPSAQQAVNVYQTIQSQAMSPAQLAYETTIALENALRYGY